jgi:hypothetical protein
MIDQTDIESAYAMLIEREKLLYEASEREIQALILWESAKVQAALKKPGDASWKIDPDYLDREKELNESQAEKRLAIHLHRLAKIEVQKLADYMRFIELRKRIEEFGNVDGKNDPYQDADLTSRNFVPADFNGRHWRK